MVLAGGSDGTLSADAIRFVGAGPAPADLRFVLGDHLGTPQKLTDNTGALVWDRLQTPFGLDYSVTGPAATPVRFPGQYADSESGLSYNYFRDYDPSLGRYIQSDPIGLAGGLNTYGYVGGNPLGYVDPYGQAAMGMGRAGGFALIAGAGRALSMAMCRASSSNAIRNAVAAAGIGTSLWAWFGPGGILLNENGTGESGQDDGGKSEDSGAAGSDGEAGGSTSVNDIIGGSNFDRETSKRTKIYDREGGFEQAGEDFDALDPESVSDKGGGVRVGDLSSGDKVIVRPNSSDGRPTLEVQNPSGKTKIKIRYN